MGNRFKGGIAEGAMPPLHKYLGNPVLSWIGRVLFRSPIGDFHCGLRGFNRQSILNLHLQTTGMEFASEMVVKSTLGGLRVSEVPTTLHKDGRSRPPHLRSWRDGWRHLRFLLIFSPRWLFLIPGAVAFFLGLLGTLFISVRARSSSATSASTSRARSTSPRSTVVGYQSVLFAILTKIYAQHEGFRHTAVAQLRPARAAHQPRERRARRPRPLPRRPGDRHLAVRDLGGRRASVARPVGAPCAPPCLAALLMMLGAQTIMAGMFLGVLKVGLRRD